MSNTRTAGTALTAAGHNADNPAPEAGMSRDIINIGLNIFRAGIRRYKEPEQELLEWLWALISQRAKKIIKLLLTPLHFIFDDIFIILYTFINFVLFL